MWEAVRVTGGGKFAALRDELQRLRDLWNREREARLERKRGLMEGGMSAAGARRDRDYRTLVKRQKRLTVRIRHIVKEMNRRDARDRER